MAICASCGAENPERAKFCLECGERLTPMESPERFRKTVTILFSDVVGSTALGEQLDPETLSRVMTEYFETVKPVVAQHGGTLAKFIGDAVMAVFGLTELHEDDALRAARTAVQMRETLARLNPELERRYGVSLSTRTGINTGPVAGAGLVPDRNFVAGDTANTAARLQTGAAPGEIVLGERTYSLVREAVDAQLLPPLAAKGKAAPLTAYKLVSLLTEATRIARRAELPLVGRQRELAELEWAFRRAVDEGHCRLVTLVAPPGAGKSGVAREFVSRLGEEARVLEGSCLSYGEGITFWPLAQMVRQAASIDEADTAEAAYAKLRKLAPSESVAEGVGQAIGLLENLAPSEGIGWAVRGLLEELAASRPLVCVWDDIQWGDPALHDLLEHLAGRSREAPILLCCLARPELLEARPAWPGTIALDPLTDSESDLLLETLVGDASLPASVRDRIAEAAGGNPLFLEQLVAMLVAEGLFVLGEGGVTVPGDAAALPVPPSIQALLAARLEGLDPDERHVLTRASVAGQTFYRGALQELVRDGVIPRLDSVLLSLVRKEFVLPTRSDLGSDDAFRFRHLLIRDAAYEALTKEARAELHAVFGRWLDQALAGRTEEVEEIVGYHLEQAYRLQAELGRPDEEAVALAEAAAERLTSAGRRALGRSDFGASATLMTRAVALLPADDPRRPALLVDLADAARECGRFAEAEAALEAAGSSGDERTRRLATIGRFRLRLDTDSKFDLAEAEVEARRGADTAELAGDDAGAASAWRLIWHIAAYRCEYAAAAEAARRAADHALRAGDPRWAFDRRLEMSAAARGTAPTSGVIALGEQVLAEVRGHDSTEGGIRWNLGLARAMRGDFELARELMLQAISSVDETGIDAYAIGGEGLGWQIAAQRGEWVAAERELRRGYDGLVVLGATSVAASVAGLLANCLCALGRTDEAEQLAAVAAEAAGEDDMVAQSLWRMARARLLVARGEAAAAVEVAREGAAFVRETDALPEAGYAVEVLAEILHFAGRPSEARAAAEDAVRIYERKEHLVGAERARGLLARLEAAPAAS